MAEALKPIGLDGEGYDLLTEAIRSLLNEFPGLYPGETIKFEELGKTSGIAFSANNGALIMNEKTSVTGKVYQKCQYPFFVIYKTNADVEYQKINVQEFLNTLGRWLSKEAVNIGKIQYKLSEYPELTDNRVILKITRRNSYGLETNEDGVQEWL